MGISANQARLMTLTARQHDLELRAQAISANKMITSLESQQYAQAYSTGLNNYSILKQAESTTNSGKASGSFKVDQFGNVSACDSTDQGAKSASDALAACRTALGLAAAAESTSYLNSIKGDYDLKMSELSSTEKLLDMELTQINTEHNAVKTEYDAVKSLVSDNTEKSFNVFG